MRIYELSPRYDARKSFYCKAHVIDYENQSVSDSTRIPGVAVVVV